MTSLGECDSNLACLHGIHLRADFALRGWPAADLANPQDCWTLEVHRGQIVNADPIQRDLGLVTGNLRHEVISGREHVALTMRSLQDFTETSINVDLSRRQISVQCDLWFPGSEALLLYLLHTRVIPAIAALTRKSAVLHATATHVPEGAIVICGRSGVGKSTLAAGLISSGALLLGDEPIVIDRGVHRSVAQPSVRSLRLEQATFAAELLANQGWTSHAGHDKSVWSPPIAAGHAEVSPVAAVLVLGERIQSGSTPDFVRLSPVAATQALMDQSHLSVDLIDAQARRFTAAAAIVESTPVFEVHMPDDADSIHSAVRLLRAGISEAGVR